MSSESEQPAKRSKTETSSELDQLKAFTTIVADTGEVNAIKAFKPQDATTNPSLLYKASQLPEYQPLVEDAIAYAKAHASGKLEQEVVDLAMDKLAVNFGTEISKIVPGYVSTEVDARLSFDCERTVERALRLIALYSEVGVSKDRILIKIASTYEGIKAAGILEKQGISCNLTLLFSLVQAAAAAENGATLISPFVGRILDWFKAKTGQAYSGDDDPGVRSVTEIYSYYKAFGYKTIVMGASFRNTDEILCLAGCDRLTIAPALLTQLSESHGHVERKLSPTVECGPLTKLDTSEANFRFLLNQDAMATEKLAEGIRGFVDDIRKLEAIVSEKLK
jgi:transaldolase